MVTADEDPKDWMAALWMAPFTIGVTMLEAMSSASQAWLQMLFAPESHHAHDRHTDLEVPDPIEDTGEHDLFA
jgi:hypothetical protein